MFYLFPTYRKICFFGLFLIVVTELLVFVFGKALLLLLQPFDSALFIFFIAI